MLIEKYPCTAGKKQAKQIHAKPTGRREVILSFEEAIANRNPKLKED